MIPDCLKISDGRYCGKHRARLVRHGDPLYERKPRLCSIENCQSLHLAKGYCNTHYMRLFRNNDVFNLKIYKNHNNKCEKNNCNGKYLAKGLCGYHYRLNQFGESPNKYLKMLNMLQEWSKRIKSRDNFSCQICGSNNKLNAHHILHKSKYPELAYLENNGITLCHKHHVEVHK